ncbi:MAG: hypothetical protein AB1716_18895 [Planctomycetota bacterium]
MTVKLRRRNPKYPDLPPDCLYPVIGIEADDLRIINDQGRPYLFPARLFKVVDRKIPADWVRETGADGERYAYPPVMNAPGFFEDFFDGDPQVTARFWHAVNQRLARAV